MKKKIVITVSMNCEKCRSKALKIAATVSGVSSVALEGESKDKVVVTGDEVDAVCLTKVLRKKFRQATIDSVEEVKDKKEGTEEKKPEETKPTEVLYCYSDQFPQCVLCHAYYDSYGSNCTIL